MWALVYVCQLPNIATIMEKVKKTNYGWNVLVYCTDEGNYDDFLRYKGTIEKIYGVRAYIKDVPFQKHHQSLIKGAGRIYG